MVVLFDYLLSETDLVLLGELLTDATWEDGSKTAGRTARTVKSNEQASGPEIETARGIVREALDNHNRFQAAAMPHSFSTILFSRYRPGMEYGTHIDNPLMTMGNTRMRSDLAMTIFLSDPESYTGGGLAIPGAPEDGLKLPRGAAVLYPATSLHSVLPVETGERLAAVLWVQSLVRDEAAREILFDVTTAKQMVEEKEGKSGAFELLAKTRANLLRRWVDL